MTDYPSFPELKAKFKPSMPLVYEDDTLASEMENGAIITRPRSSRARRTWAVELLPFDQEDFDKLDYFVRTTVRGAAALFYFTVPNADIARNERLLVRFVKGQTPAPRFATIANVRGVPTMLYAAAFQIREL